MRCLFTISLLFVALISHAQNIIWEQDYEHQSTATSTVLFSLAPSSNGGFVVTGDYGISNSLLYPLFHYRVDASGNFTNIKTGVDIRTGGEDIQTLPDRGYAIVNSLYLDPSLSGGDYCDIGLQRYDSLGNLLWTRTYNGFQGDYPTSLRLMPDGGFLIGCFVDHINPGGGGRLNLRVLRTDSSGNLIWQRALNGLRFDYSASAIRHSSGSYYLSAQSMDMGTSFYHPLIWKLNAVGDSVTAQRYILRDSLRDETHRTYWHNLTETSEGNLMTSGWIDSSGTASYSYICKLDTNLQILWKTFLYPASSNSKLKVIQVREMADNTFMTVAREENIFSKLLLIRLNASGQELSRTSYFPACNKMEPYEWEFLSDSSVMVVGRCFNAPYKGYMLKIGKQPNITSVPDLINQSNGMLRKVFPNPAHTFVTITYMLPNGAQQSELSVQELATGRTVQRHTLGAGSAQQVLDLKGVANGLYAVTLRMEGRVVGVEKLVVIQ